MSIVLSRVNPSYSYFVPRPNFAFVIFVITLTSFLGQRGPTPLFINQHQNGKFECERTLTSRKKKSGIGPYISCGKLTLLAFLSF